MKTLERLYWFVRFFWLCVELGEVRRKWRAAWHLARLMVEE